MFTVFIVDDEPAAVLYLNQLVRLVKEDFEITGEFGDAVSCLDKLEECRPDVIITDIKMPGMSGLELARRVNEKYPKTACLILSGYSEFEYAREAIRGRVFEYLLKPIIPDEFIKAMNRIRIMISGRYLKERSQLIQVVCRGAKIEEGELKRYFPYEGYYGILMRKNGFLPEEYGEKERMVSSGLNESIVMYGCDENEELVLAPRECVINDSLSRIAERLKKELGTEQDKFAVIMTRSPFKTEQMASVIRKLYQRLYETAVLGKDTAIYLEMPLNTPDLEKREKFMIEEIKELLIKGENEAAYLGLGKLWDVFVHKAMPELIVRRTVKYLMNTLWMFSEGSSEWKENEILLDNLLYSSTSMESLYKNLKELFQIKEHEANPKIDTQENFQRIRNYVLCNLSEPLSLGKLGKEFGISQAYLTRMFRKYENTSFNNFLTAARMEKAKKVILGHPDLYMKEVAAIAGYQDQFYFSRVFRAYTGYCPSDYQLLNEE